MPSGAASARKHHGSVAPGPVPRGWARRRVGTPPAGSPVPRGRRSGDVGGWNAPPPPHHPYGDQRAAVAERGAEPDQDRGRAGGDRGVDRSHQPLVLGRRDGVRQRGRSCRGSPGSTRSTRRRTTALRPGPRPTGHRHPRRSGCQHPREVFATPDAGTTAAPGPGTGALAGAARAAGGSPDRAEGKVRQGAPGGGAGVGRRGGVWLDRSSSRGCRYPHGGRRAREGATWGNGSGRRGTSSTT